MSRSNKIVIIGLAIIVLFLANARNSQAEEINKISTEDAVLDARYMIASTSENENVVISNMPCASDTLSKNLPYASIKMILDKGAVVQGCWWHNGDTIISVFSDDMEKSYNINANWFQPLQ